MTIARPHRRPGWFGSRCALAVFAGVLAATTLAACSGSSGSSAGSSDSAKYGFKTATQSASATITVWVDADRAAAATPSRRPTPASRSRSSPTTARRTARTRSRPRSAVRPGRQRLARCRLLHPEQRRRLGQPEDQRQAGVRRGAEPGPGPAGHLSNFTKGALDPCTVNGKVYCLRNDLAQNVLWFNKTLMDQFGYTVPDDVGGLPDAQREGGARDHPGYIIGCGRRRLDAGGVHVGQQVRREPDHRSRGRSPSTPPARSASAPRR